MTVGFEVVVKFESDWGVSTGGGRHGDVDRLVRRDAAGLPYVPAKTLLAILRDATERLAWGLDNGSTGGWSAWVDYVFGSQPGRQDVARAASLAAPRPGVLVLDDAMIVAGEGRAGTTAVGWTMLKPGVELDRDTGVARDKHLRVEEVARGGVELVARGGWSVAGGVPQEATALLAVACRLVERIGGKRRRGHGRCDVRLKDHELERERRVLEGSPSSPPGVATPSRAFTPSLELSTEPWRRQAFELVVTSPIVVPRETLGNVVTSETRVPGTYLLGWLDKALSRSGSKTPLLDALAAGRVLVTHATPEIAGSRGLPVPFSYFRPKSGVGLPRAESRTPSCDVVNRLVQGTTSNGAQLKGMRGGWVSDTDRAKWPFWDDIELTATTHNTVDDRVQRPTQAVGGVYTFESIPAGTRLRFEVRWSTTLPADWWRNAARDVRLGLAKKAEYGAARIAALKVADSGDPAATEPLCIEPDGATLTVWLLSEVLLRDQGLRPSALAEALRGLIENKLRKDAPAVTLVLDERKGLVSSMLRAVRIDSWSAGWQLPRPSLIGLAAGGVARFRVGGFDGKDTKTVARLRARLLGMAWAGLGERTSEGFGQVRFDDPRLVNTGLTAPAALPATPDPGAGTVVEHPGAAERRAMAAAMERGSDADEAWSALGGNSHWPSASQLGALRAAIGRLERCRAENVNPVAAWLDAVGRNRRRSSAWSGVGLKLRRLATEPDEVAELVGLQAGALDEGFAAKVLRAFILAALRDRRRSVENKGDKQEGG